MIDDNFRRNVAIKCNSIGEVVKVKDILDKAGEKVLRPIVSQKFYRYLVADGIIWMGDSNVVDREIIVDAEEILNNVKY